MPSSSALGTPSNSCSKGTPGNSCRSDTDLCHSCRSDIDLCGLENSSSNPATSSSDHVLPLRFLAWVIIIAQHAARSAVTPHPRAITTFTLRLSPLKLDDGGAGAELFCGGAEVAADPKLVEKNTVRVSKVLGNGFDDGAAVLDALDAAAAEGDDIDVGLLESGIGAAVAVVEVFDGENKDESEAAKEDEDEDEGEG